MKGVFQTKPHFDSIREVFERVQSDEKKDFEIAILYEYLTLTQINSIPNGATPFRSPGYNVLSLVRWPHDTPENLKYAGELVRELTNIVLKGRAELLGSENSGYGNYGQLLLIVQTPIIGVQVLMPQMSTLAFLPSRRVKWPRRARLKGCLESITRECNRSRRYMTPSYFFTSGFP
jgi:hypothetical protein